MCCVPLERGQNRRSLCPSGEAFLKAFGGTLSTQTEPVANYYTTSAATVASQGLSPSGADSRGFQGQDYQTHRHPMGEVRILFWEVWGDWWAAAPQEAPRKVGSFRIRSDGTRGPDRDPGASGAPTITVCPHKALDLVSGASCLCNLNYVSNRIRSWGFRGPT